MLFSVLGFEKFYPRTSPSTSDARNRIIKIVKRILAIPTAAPAMPVNPSTPAISAIIKNMSVHPNINVLPLCETPAVTPPWRVLVCFFVAQAGPSLRSLFKNSASTSPIETASLSGDGCASLNVSAKVQCGADHSM